MENKNKDRFEITEMFMAQADHERCFYIKRSTKVNGQPHLFSRIVVHNGLIQVCTSDQKTLGKMLDEICIMVLDYGIHNNDGIKIRIQNEPIYLN